jgi:hypothetical protein
MTALASIEINGATLHCVRRRSGATARDQRTRA